MKYGLNKKEIIMHEKNSMLQIPSYVVNDLFITPAVVTYNCHILIWWKSTRRSASANTRYYVIVARSLYIISLRYFDSDAVCLYKNNIKFLFDEIEINIEKNYLLSVIYAQDSFFYRISIAMEISLDTECRLSFNPRIWSTRPGAAGGNRWRQATRV